MFIANYFISFLVSFAMAMFMIVAIGVIIFGEVLIAKLQMESLIYYDVFWINLLQFVVFVIMIYGVIATLYYFGLRRMIEPVFFFLGVFQLPYCFLEQLLLLVY